MVSVRIKVTVPQKVLDDKAVVNAIAAAQRQKTAPDIRKLFSGTVEGWTKKPDFAWRQDIKTNSIGVRIFAQGQHADTYALVNAGARPHTIVPKRGGMLRFQPGYRAATRRHSSEQ